MLEEIRRVYSPNVVYARFYVCLVYFWSFLDFESVGSLHLKNFTSGTQHLDMMFDRHKKTNIEKLSIKSNLKIT